MSDVTPPDPAQTPPRRTLGTKPQDGGTAPRPSVVPPQAPAPAATPVDLAAVREAREAQARPALQGPSDQLVEYNRSLRLIAAELALGLVDESQVRAAFATQGMPPEAIETTLGHIDTILDTMAKNLSNEAPARELLNRAGAGMAEGLLEYDSMKGVELTFTLRRTAGGYDFAAYAHMSREFSPGLPEWAYTQLTNVVNVEADRLGDLLAATLEGAWTKLQGG